MPGSGGGLDPQLSFANGLDDSGTTLQSALSFITDAFQRNLQTFYNDFTVHQYRPGLELLRGWQRVVRFGATALSITTLLVLLGLVVGTRRSRLGVLLFGVSGLALIIAPALTANYYGRYTIPMAPPLMAGAAVTFVALWRGFKSRRAESRHPGTAEVGW